MKELWEALPEAALLTSRQRQVVSLMLEWLTDKEIAVRLGISERTVKHHATQFYRKLGFQEGEGRRALFKWASRVNKG